MTEYRVYRVYPDCERELLNTFLVGEGKRLYDFVVSRYDILYAGNNESCIGFEAFIWDGIKEIKLNVFR